MHTIVKVSTCEMLRRRLFCVVSTSGAVDSDTAPSLLPWAETRLLTTTAYKVCMQITTDQVP